MPTLGGCAARHSRDDLEKIAAEDSFIRQPFGDGSRACRRSASERSSGFSPGWAPCAFWRSDSTALRSLSWRHPPEFMLFLLR